MDNQTFMLYGGIVIALMGLTYIVSEKLALAFFYLRKFGINNIIEILLSERSGVIMIRFGLGPVLLVAGLWLIGIALGWPIVVTR